MRTASRPATPKFINLLKNERGIDKVLTKEYNGNMKEQKDKMMAMHQQGITYQEIGKFFGVSRQRVHQIVSGYKSKSIKKSPIVRIEDGFYLNNFQKSQIKKLKEENNRCGWKMGREYKREMIRIYFNHTCQSLNCSRKDRQWHKGERRFDVHHFSCDPKDTKKYDAGKLKDVIKGVSLLCHKCHLSLPEHLQKMTRINYMKDEKYERWLKKQKSVENL